MQTVISLGLSTKPIKAPRRRNRGTGRWLMGASGGAVAMMVTASPAQAQLANLGGALGHAVNVPVQPVVVTSPSATPTLSPTMVQIAARHAAYQARVSSQANIVASANAASRAAAASLQQTITNGIGANGLKAVDISKQNTSALTVWVGAEQPTQTALTTPVNGATVQVDVKQTQERALLSWESFNVGKETLLNFNQQGHSDWVVVNRLVGGINPETGLTDPSFNPSPTQILGQIKAEGTVFILNRSGVLFGATSQVDLHSLVASTLELGRTLTKDATGKETDVSLDTLNSSFLQNGILPGSHVALLGSVTGESHGDVQVAAGAQIRSTGGFVILAAPKVSMAGEINPTLKPDGSAATPALGAQVSLVAGNYVDASSSSGSADSTDPYVRGLILTSQGGGTVDVSGSINARQGYISLVTDPTGTINLSGILSSTTSVSRNGKISLIGGKVNLLTAPILDQSGAVLRDSAGVAYQSTGTLAITPDLDGATIPQAADSVAAFKTSQIDIGNYDTQLNPVNLALLQTRNADAGLLTPTLLPSLVSIGDGSTIYMPGGDVNVGGKAGGPRYSASAYTNIGPTGVTVGADAVIDVSGVDSVAIAAARNQLVISPAKKNELRDTPLYRDSATDGGFSLNGATLYVDPRLSGVRSDGVAWVGSPLLEAGSLADQIGITAPELLTKGGNVTLATMTLDQNSMNIVPRPSVTLAPTATIDFSGGWVNYAGGEIRTSKLITSDGRVVDIGSADPNDSFVGVANGFVETLPQLGAPRVYANSLINATRYESAYAEGRDAGSFTVSAPTAELNANLHGSAVAGERQVLDAKQASKAATTAGDPRHLQAAHGELPSAGLLRFSTALGGSVLVGGKKTVLADGSAGVDVNGQSIAAPEGLIHILETTINQADLSAVVLETSGSVTLAPDSKIDLNAGGAFVVKAGRAVSFNGEIDVPSGTISAQTYGNRFGDLYDAGDDINLDRILTGGEPVWLSFMETVSGLGTAHPDGWFDISVNPDAVLSTRGLWTNDLLVTDGLFGGGAYTSGGSVSLAVAPHIVAFTDATQTKAVDLSGSISIAAGSLLDVSGGGYVSSTGVLQLSGKGGNVTLKNETVYFQLAQTDQNSQGSVKGSALFNSDISTFQITPNPGKGNDSAVVPDEIRAKVEIADDTIRGFGFQGGGTFTLVTPDLNFGNSGGTGTQIGLDFLAKTGFATLDLTTWNTTLIDNVFNNGRTGKTALLSTEIVKIGAGETLNLTQSVLPTLLSVAQIGSLRALDSGTDVSRLADFAPSNQYADYYQKAANLVLGGLTELDILGGTITGAAGASITVPKLYQAGTIAIHGGSITQSEFLPAVYVNSGIAVGQQIGDTPVDLVQALSGIFGKQDEDGRYTETQANADFLAKVGSDHQIYYLGRLAREDGIVFTQDSVTDLSGAVLLNPLAGSVDGTAVRSGRLVDGGSITALGRYLGARDMFGATALGEDSLSYNLNAVSPYSPTVMRLEREINAAAGARIDISGAQGVFDMRSSGASLVATQVWSNGGTFTGLGGGDVSRATISASGGAAGATGGTFDWYNPILRQNLASAIPTGASASGNIVSADQLTAGGFDRLIARGTLSTLGDVTLKLGRAFILKSAESLGTTGELRHYATTITGTGDLSITAPHIVLSSIQQGLTQLPEWKAADYGGNSLTIRAEAASGTGASFDVIGAVGLDAGFATAKLSSQGDIRLIGVQPITATLDPTSAVNAPSLTGVLAASGTLELQARQIYATTGTGNLLRDPTAKASDTYTGAFQIASLAKSQSGPTVTFSAEPGTTAATPYSAGSYIQVLGESILQAGALYAPAGRIDLGSRLGAGPQGLDGFGDQKPDIQTKSVTLAQGSITSVSGDDLTIPFGTTTDLTDTYFLPTLKAALASLPAAQLSLSADVITTDAGATVNASGGGKLLAYEFVSGTGGSRDVLSRYNTDSYSGNAGYQYADHRQVYAILPVDSPLAAALYDPIYSADYAALYGEQVGKTVHLDAVADSAPGKKDGLAAGDYVLLPAKYAALLPGAMRLVENTGVASPLVGQGTRALDGSINVGGTFGVSGTAYNEALRRAFTVQSQAVFRQYSQISTTDVAAKVEAKAIANNIVIPRLPTDAAKIVIDPGTGLTIGNMFQTSARTSAGGKAGRGSQVDILGSILSVVSSKENAAKTGVSIVADTLANLGAASLMIGGTREDRADGSTAVTVTASEVHVRNTNADPALAGAAINLAAPEIILAGMAVDVADNAVLTATGTLADTRDGVYDLTVAGGTDGTQRVSTAGSFLRLANGPERLLDRIGELPVATGKDIAKLTIGTARFSGESLILDTSLNISMTTADLAVNKLVLASDSMTFSAAQKGLTGFIITPELEAKLAAISQVTLISPGTIGFAPGGTASAPVDHVFQDLIIDAAGLRLVRPTANKSDGSALTLGIRARNVSLRNSFEDLGSCAGTSTLACGATASSLTLNASGSLTLGSGTFRTYGFESKIAGNSVTSAQVAITAAGGVYYEGKGSLELADAALTLTTPFIADRGTDHVPDAKSVQADYAVNTINSVKIAAPQGVAAVLPETVQAPGARFLIGSTSSAVGSLEKADGTLVSDTSLSITDTVIRASAGNIGLFAEKDLTLAGTAQLQATSYKRTFGANGDPDQVTVSANGGRIDLTARTGDIALGASTRIALGGATGESGDLSLFASQGRIGLNGTIDAAAPGAGGSFAFDAGLSALDLSAFMTSYGAQFTGDVDIRTGVGNLALDGGSAAVSRFASLKLVADGGTVSIDRKIDTSGANGGDISLNGRAGVTLGASAILDTHSTGYELTDTRQARAGNVLLATSGDGAISVASGAQLNLGVTRAEARLVPKSQIDPDTLNPTTSYTLVEADIGGTLTLRAPAIEQAGADTVNISFGGAVTGASDVSVVAFKRYDLGAIAANDALSGVIISDGVAILNPAGQREGRANFLTDETSPDAIPYFIQHFDISGAYAKLGGLASLANFHARAGVDLDYAGDIRLSSAWNLAAGYVSDYAAAVDSGALVVSPLSQVTGQTVYAVGENREADLFQNYIHMLYRTGSGANAGGEAATFTFRAGGNLDIGASISDGFFNFADQTDAAYLNYRLGGGKLLVQPVYAISCGANDCTQIADYPVDGSAIKASTSINITLNQPNRAQLIDFVAPYSDSANGASPLSAGLDGGGNPLGGAALFPLLADGSAASSSDIQLVGGAGKSFSVDRLHVDRGSDGDVIVEGSTSYQLTATARTTSYSGEALVRIAGSDQTSLASGLSAETLFASVGATSIEDLATKSTRITFGRNTTVASKLLLAAAQKFVEDHADQAVLLGTKTAPTGIATTMDLALQFLNETNAFELLADGMEGRSSAVGVFEGLSRYQRFTGNLTATVPTMVRTGTGQINIAAARNVDLTNGDPVLLNEFNRNSQGANTHLYQVGGTAVYTAGHRVNPALVTATVVGTGQVLTVDPTSHLPTATLVSTAYNPVLHSGALSRPAELQANPVFATGGGSISIAAGNDVLGRRDVQRDMTTLSPLTAMIGEAGQAWRVGAIGGDQNDVLNSTYIRINPYEFRSGVGALGGGNVSIDAGHDLKEMSIALDTTLATADIGDSFGAMIFGGGNLNVRVGGTVDGGQFDIASGEANVTAAADIGGLGYLRNLRDNGQDTAIVKKVELLRNLLEIRTTDARVNLFAGGSIRLNKVSALGVTSSPNSTGFYTGNSALVARAGGDFQILGPSFATTRVLPATLDVISMTGDIDLGTPANFLYPGARGQLSLLAAHTVKASAINLDDGEASYLPGLYSVYRTEISGNLLQGRNFYMPGVFANTPDYQRRMIHNAGAMRAGDDTPARIMVGDSLTNLTVYSGKQIRISAGEDIVNMIFFGQNNEADDVTRIVAGRDITASSAVSSSLVKGYTSNRKLLQGNYFALGGPGSLVIEAGRNMGPFLNSATVASYLYQAGPDGAHYIDPQPAVGKDSYGGGILAVGDTLNPWLAPKSADIYVSFGVANGANYDALRETYINPANLDALPGDLFEQNVDSFGNKTPDRTRPIYGPILIAWMKANAQAALIARFGTSDVSFAQAYEAFAAMPVLTQRRFLLDKVYFNELAAPSDPNGNSFQQYVRGYRAVDTLFPSSLGYTLNDLSGASNGGTRVATGNLDLRLAAIETARDSNITILGPGGDAILGSVVRTDAQAAGLAYQAQNLGADFSDGARALPSTFNLQVQSIPIGYEGVLTLRGGAIHSFTDGDLRLNQSRLFSQQSGNIVLWSSNGDLNAGQGPKSAANVPPIVLRFDPNGSSDVDSAGAVVGAGIAGFTGIRRRNEATGVFELVSVLDDADVAAADAQLKTLASGATVTLNGKTYSRDVPSIYLVAPAGTVDAGDAGVRAGGDIFVAAAQVTNADNFKVGGSAVGIPSLASTSAPALPASAASALAANVFQTNPSSSNEERSRIFVDVLGYFNANGTQSSDCLDEDGKPKPQDACTTPDTAASQTG